MKIMKMLGGFRKAGEVFMDNPPIEIKLECVSWDVRESTASGTFKVTVKRINEIVAEEVYLRASKRMDMSPPPELKGAIILKRIKEEGLTPKEVKTMSNLLGGQPLTIEGVKQAFNKAIGLENPLWK